jgi:very-long-chain ceramide synthase
MFGVFMFSWLIARHVCYMMVVYSVWAHTPEIIPPNGFWVGKQDNLTGPHLLPERLQWQQTFGPLWKSDSMVYFNDPIRNSFLALLLFLQGLTIVWFTMIINVAMRVLRGDGADDTRSDDEGQEEEEEYVYEEAQPLEEEVGVEQLDLKSWERRTGVRRQAATSSVSIPGHSDRKELLGRIGCEKQVD